MPSALPLRPLEAPPALPWPGPTPFEWLLLLALGLGLFQLLRLLRRQLRRRRWRRDLHTELARLAAHADTLPERTTAEALVLIRRLLFLHHPRERIAAVTGEAWLAELEALCADRWFSEGEGRTLAHAGHASPGDPRTARLALEAVRRLIEASLARRPDPPRA
jgi:hypothetical protein